ncbi:flagellin [Sulfurimonas gotlandica GD1]|uniref:Flagellin n=1 Tax=Sulfurimonas gotlandica (strain DSM 19862 / JCM 16533 / GD1) TaxID=929558 RepID=H1FYU2_SULGG|nr:flagellin [Sulfurimonas gotlandica GD1]
MIIFRVVPTISATFIALFTTLRDADISQYILKRFIVIN